MTLSKVHTLYAEHSDETASSRDKISQKLEESIDCLEQFAIDSGIYGNGKLLINTCGDEDITNHSLTVRFAIICKEKYVELYHGKGNSSRATIESMNRENPGWENLLIEQKVPIIRKQDAPAVLF